MNLFKIKIRLETRPVHSRLIRIIGIYNEQKKIEKNQSGIAQWIAKFE